MKKYAMHTLSAAAALAAALAFGAQAQAQTSPNPASEAPSSRTTPPAGPNVTPKDAQARTDGKMQKKSARMAKKPVAKTTSDAGTSSPGTGAAPKETGGGAPNKTMP